MSFRKDKSRGNKGPTLADCQADAQRLRKERDTLYLQTQYDAKYIKEFQLNYRQLEHQLKTIKDQKSDLERTHNKTMKVLVHNEKEAVIVTLKEDITRLQGERDDRDKQIADLKADKDELQTNENGGGVIIKTLKHTTEMKRCVLNVAYDSKKEEQIQKLTNENKRLKEENEELNQKLDEQKKQYDKMLAEVDEEKKQKNRFSIEREKTINDLKKTSVDKTLKDENSRLHGELNKLNIENAGLRKEVDRIRTSLSKIAGDRMTDDNPYITDLCDPQRPQKLSEKLNDLYENSRTDAYELFNTEDIDEKLINEKLIALFKSTWEFCCEVSKNQLSELHNIVLSLDEKGSTEKKKVKDEYPVQNSKLLKETRRQFAKQFIPTLCKCFWKRQKEAGMDDSIQPYVNKCIELCWYSAISDPPVVFAFDADDIQGYTLSGDEIDYVVWPAMYLHEYGPLLYDGVIKFKDD